MLLGILRKLIKRNLLIRQIQKIILFTRFRSSFQDFVKLNSQCPDRFPLDWKDRYPCLYDKTSQTEYDRHYILHPAWAARVLSQTKPELHIDISSTMYFSTIISAFIKVDFYDFRKAEINLSGLKSERANLTCLNFPDGYIKSLSCMHVVEHIGLGRYGDSLDYDGDLKAIHELIRVLASGGNLLFVVPIASQPRLFFNAHRVYSTEQILEYFSNLKLQEYCLIPDSASDGFLVKNPSCDLLNKQQYACGCFWFKKI